MNHKKMVAFALGLGLATTLSSQSLAQGFAAVSTPSALGASEVAAQSKEAASVLLGTVKTVVKENPSYADSVGDRALIKAVERATASRPDLSIAIANVAKKLKPHLSASIDLAATNAVAFDGAIGAMEESAPPAWADEPVAEEMAVQGDLFAADEGAPEWAVASMPVANDISGGAQGDGDLLSMDLEDLMNTKVVTASKSKERAFDVPAAIYVITNEDLRRSGHTTVQEALRMVPGMNVSRIDSDSWSVSTRGFGDEYANKQLVMIDGRSIYSPTFSGVYWDQVNLPLEDIDRIEVIRGPGATIWGANAVNGVINIVTKDSKFTQGAYVSTGVGSYERAFVEGRSGGELGDYGHYRMYGRYFKRDRTEELSGSDANNGWWRLLSGFRADWNNSNGDDLTIQGEVQKGGNEQETVQFGVGDDARSTVAYLRGAWDRVLDNGSSINVSSYLDHDHQKSLTVESRVTNFDINFNHNTRWMDRNDLIWGAGYRLSSDEYVASAALDFVPDEKDMHLFSAFVQNKFEATDKLDLTAGTKFEHNSFTGFEIQPTAKFSYRPSENSTFWGSVARAVRTPSRVEDGVRYPLQVIPASPPGTPLETIVQARGNGDVESEELIAYELGYRISPKEGLLFDLAAYYNDYDNLVTLRQGAPFISLPNIIVPVDAFNAGEATMYGVELSASWQVMPSWKLSGYYAYANMDLETALTDQPFLYYDRLWPEHTFSIRSNYNITEDLEWDAALYYVASLDDALNVDNATPTPIDAYWRGDMRLGWRPWDQLELSLVGQNLIEGNHRESIDSRFNTSTNIGRTYYGKATWHF